MGNRNWDYSTNRNSKTNEFFGGFENKGDKKYNITTIKKYFIESKKLNVWEKKVYKSLREQDFNFTDKQFDLIYSIYKKYSK